MGIFTTGNFTVTDFFEPLSSIVGGFGSAIAFLLIFPIVILFFADRTGIYSTILNLIIAVIGSLAFPGIWAMIYWFMLILGVGKIIYYIRGGRTNA